MARGEKSEDREAFRALLFQKAERDQKSRAVIGGSAAPQTTFDRRDNTASHLSLMWTMAY
ncbi:hypothetical protein N7478_004900 [Penicillium angulare]|uniref:uncharacterized protein n=1 Tax=Penicillium angulare TaxID=116970 RepID=UPI00254026B2|nr:uncharacterized protein N7478_004900 [Penicillium angulare]KAJ5279528.1 hypothetical protein N7478_004900 [Penicillium angulare]